MAKKKSSKTLPSELYELEQVVGQFMEYWGFKNIHGRIWAHLFTSSVPLDTLELMERLQVSKGLMSLALRELLEHKVIIADHTGRHGSVFYRANEDLKSVITHVLREREMKILEKTQKICASLEKLKPEVLQSFDLDKNRVKTVKAMTVSAHELLGFFLDQGSAEADQLFSLTR